MKSDISVVFFTGCLDIVSLDLLIVKLPFYLNDDKKKITQRNLLFFFTLRLTLNILLKMKSKPKQINCFFFIHILTDNFDKLQINFFLADLLSYNSREYFNSFLFHSRALCILFHRIKLMVLIFFLSVGGIELCWPFYGIERSISINPCKYLTKSH